MRKFLLIAGLLFSFSLAAVAQESPTNNENEAVRQVVQAYLNDNIELKQKALDPDAKIISVHSGNGKIITTDIFKKPRPRKMPKGAIVILPTQKIVAVDVAPGAATVKVESEFPPFSEGEKSRRYFQYLSLLKRAGEWKIVSVLMPSEFEESPSK